MSFLFCLLAFISGYQIRKNACLKGYQGFRNFESFVNARLSGEFTFSKPIRLRFMIREVSSLDICISSLSLDPLLYNHLRHTRCFLLMLTFLCCFPSSFPPSAHWTEYFRLSGSVSVRSACTHQSLTSVNC